ncbi:hypothetical protein ACKWTF_015718 [Chironomus riparius]
MQRFFSTFANDVELRQQIAASNLPYRIVNPPPGHGSFRSLLRDRERQVNPGFIDAVITAKHPNDSLTAEDLYAVRVLITDKLGAVDLNDKIQINMDGPYMEVFRCQNLQSFLWFLEATTGLIVNSKETKQSAINDGTVYNFYTMLPVPYTDHFLLRDIPRFNGDFDTSHWRTESDGQHVIYEVDLLSACLLYNRQYVLQYGQTAYNLALMCNLD